MNGEHVHLSTIHFLSKLSGGIYLKKRLLILGTSIIAVVLVVTALLALYQGGIIPASSDPISVIILHTNVVHGRVPEEPTIAMGYAHMAATIKEIRENNENVLLLDAGDAFQGSSSASLSKGESIVSIMNAMKYDAMAAGNHEFGYGWQRLVELAEMAEFPVLSANTYGQDGKELLESYTIKKLNGIRVGIFGLTTVETATKTSAANVEGITFADPVEKAKEMVQTLRKKKCDLVIALVHLPIVDAGDSCERLAQEVEGIDLIVSGHSHVALEEGMEVNDTLIVQAGEYGKSLGVVTVEMKKREPAEIRALLYTPEWSEEGLPGDEEIQAVIDEYEKENDKILSEVIGRTDELLDGDRIRLRTGETNLGRLIAKAMLSATEADVALINGGGIRDSIKPGEITRRDVLNVLPFNNVVIVKEIKGSDLLQAIEHGVALYPEPAGRYPQLAGLEFSFSPDREPGNRVTRVTVAGKALDPEKMYRVAMNDFNASGGDGYAMFEKCRVLAEFGPLDSIVAEYIRKNFN